MVKWLFAIMTAMFLLSFYSNAQWEKANGGKELPDSTAISAILTKGNTVIAATATKGIYYSTNNGENWVQKNNGLEGLIEITALGLKGNQIFLGTIDGVYISTDNCETWNEKVSGMSGEGINCFLVINNNILAGTSSGIYMSTDNGNNWISKNQGITDYEWTGVNSLAIKGTTIFAGTTDGIYTTTNNGDNWTRKNFQDIVSSIVVHKNNIYISGDGVNTGVHVSTDNGSSWVDRNNGLDIAHSTKFYLLSHGDSVYAGASRTGVFMTNDNGNNWIPYSEGLSAYVQGNELMLASNDKYLFVGSKGATGFCNLWRLPFTDAQDTQAVNDDYYNSKILEINPNPVTDRLNLKIILPTDDIISIALIDILGNSTVIANREMKYKGENNISIPVSNLSAGTYYIRLVTSSGTIAGTVVIFR